MSVTAMSVITIDRADLTLLVLPAEQAQCKDLPHSYPIDLGDTPVQIEDELGVIASLEDITVEQFVLVGVEFEDPDQHNTTATVSGADLGALSWAVGDAGGVAMLGARGVLSVLTLIRSVDVPVYA